MSVKSKERWITGPSTPSLPCLQLSHAPPLPSSFLRVHPQRSQNQWLLSKLSSLTGNMASLMFSPPPAPRDALSGLCLYASCSDSYFCPGCFPLHLWSLPDSLT